MKLIELSVTVMGTWLLAMKVLVLISWTPLKNEARPYPLQSFTSSQYFCSVLYSLVECSSLAHRVP